MNRHTIPPQTDPPYTNGHYEAPLELSGVSLRPPPPVQKPTVFLDDLPLAGLGALVYGLHRFHLAGIPFSRYIAFLWPAIALLAVGGIIPGRWLTATVALLLWIGHIVVGLRYRRAHYVAFVPAPLPVLNELPLDTPEKLPIYATGLFGVEGRYQQYTALPGFYRTFGTGEHAILCRANARNWLALLGWPADEIGMWYAFINPSDIEQLAWGRLHFGSHDFPAISVAYRLEIPPNARRKQAEIRQETLFIATPELGDAQRLYVDLLSNIQPDKVVTQPHPSHHAAPK